MPVPGANSNFDSLATQVINRWMSAKYASYYPSHHPFLFKLYKKGNITDGGTGPQFVYPFRYPSLNNPKVSGVTSGFNSLPAAVETGGISAHTFTPAQFGMLVAIETYLLNMEGSMTKKMDQVKTIMLQAMDAYAENHQAMLWAPEATVGSAGDTRYVMGSLLTYMNGGGTANNSTYPIPKPKPAQATVAVGTNPITKVGGVERNAAGGRYFQPNLYNPGSAATPSLNLLNILLSAATLNQEMPDLIILPEALYNFFMTTLQGLIRFGESDLAKVGFKNSFEFRGADVIFDDGCPSSDLSGVANTNQIFCLNTDHFFLECDTMKPQFALVPVPDKLLLQWKSEQTIQLCFDHSGRLHSRHAKVGDPA
jgi:hypothetical protein